MLVDSSTVICWSSSFVILWESGLFWRIYSIFDGSGGARSTSSYFQGAWEQAFNFVELGSTARM